MDAEATQQEREGAARDLGRLVTELPRTIVRARSVDDVVAAVRSCASRGEPLAVRGSAHTTGGQALAAGGVVLDLSGLPTPADAGSEDRLVVSAGETWASAVGRALARGRTFPVLPDFLGLTVGGTLCHGGVGEGSFREGAQTDHVHALEVVTGAGDLLRCSRSALPELFDTCRAGLGQCAVIVSAELSLVPAPDQVTVRTTRLPDATGLVHAHLERADADDADALRSTVDPLRPGRLAFRLHAAVGHPRGAVPAFGPSAGKIEATETFAYLDFLRRLDGLEAAMRRLGAWDAPHPWAYFADAARVLHLPRDGRILGYALDPRRVHTPLLRLPDGEPAVLLGLLRNAVPSARASALLEDNARLWRRCAAAGGRVYPAGAVPMTAADWRYQLGDRWETLASAKRRFDPAGILAPGRRIFA